MIAGTLAALTEAYHLSPSSLGLKVANALWGTSTSWSGFWWAISRSSPFHSPGAEFWVYISEVFPNQVRAKGRSLGSFSHWFMNALISGIFPLMAVSSGAYSFVFSSVMMVLQFIVVLFLYPETKGESLEEMQRRLAIGKAYGYVWRN